MSEIAALETPRPTVYFIDDSATMREVMKIAFRRENIGVVACQDAATALTEIQKAQPDVVINDVIMPDKNGFEVCQFIKQHPQLGRTPAVLLSGGVNREVADKAFSVKADELIRKPFQPQDLIARVKQLLAPKAAAAPLPPPSVPANGAARPGAVFGGVFANGQPPARTATIGSSDRADGTLRQPGAFQKTLRINDQIIRKGSEFPDKSGPAFGGQHTKRVPPPSSQVARDDTTDRRMPSRYLRKYSLGHPVDEEIAARGCGIR